MALPTKLLVHCFQLLDDPGGRQRVCTLPLVCRAWRDAAPAACSWGLVAHLKTPAGCRMFAAWLHRHGGHLQELTITTLLAAPGQPARQLLQLGGVHDALAVAAQQLRSLVLVSEATDADAGRLALLCPTLRSLDLGVCTTRLTDACVSSLAALSTLQRLDLSRSCLGDQGLQLIAAQLQHLEALRLDYTQPGIGAAGLQAISSLSALTALHCAVATPEQRAVLFSEHHALAQEPGPGDQGGTAAPASSSLQPGAAAEVLLLLPAGLQELNLKGHALGIDGVAALAASPAAASLTWLTLAGCQICDTAAALLAPLNVEVLDVSCNQLTDVGVRALSLPLRVLDVSANSLCGVAAPSGQRAGAESSPDGSSSGSPSVMSAVCRRPGGGATVVPHSDDNAMGQPAHAPAAAAWLTSEGMASSASSPGASSAFDAVADTLQDLSLAHNVLRGSCLRRLRPLQRLRALNLSCCGITDAGLAGLSALQGLRALNLSGNSITDTSVLLQQLAALTQLTELQLQQLGIHEDAAEQVKLLLGNMQLEAALRRKPQVADAAVLHLPSCGVAPGSEQLDGSVAVVVTLRAYGSHDLVLAEQLLQNALASSGNLAPPPSAVVVLDRMLPRQEDGSLDMPALLPEVLAALSNVHTGE